jgi:hypothetical protein
MSYEHKINSFSEKLSSSLEYMTEGYKKIELDKIIELIKRDCKPFLKHNTPLYRGMELKMLASGIKDVRQDRRPLDSAPEYHKLLEAYMAKHKLPSRAKSLFCFADPKANVVDFGDPYVIFPKGNFNFVWFKSIKDLISGNVINGMHNLDDDYDTSKDIETNIKMLWDTATPGNIDSILNKTLVILDTVPQTNKVITVINTLTSLKHKEFATNTFPKHTVEIALDCKDYYFMRGIMTPKLHKMIWS